MLSQHSLAILIDFNGFFGEFWGRMKKQFLSIFCVLILSAGVAPAYGLISPKEHTPFGLGLILGEPTGLTAKYWLASRWAIDAGVSYSFREYFHFYSDSIWHSHTLASQLADEFKDISLYWGIGAGLRIVSKGDPDEGDARGNLMVRLPLGLEWLPNDPSIGPFLELVPGMGLVPKTFFDFGGGIGIRYYF